MEECLHCYWRVQNVLNPTFLFLLLRLAFFNYQRRWVFCKRPGIPFVVHMVIAFSTFFYVYQWQGVLSKCVLAAMGRGVPAYNVGTWRSGAFVNLSLRHIFCRNKSWYEPVIAVALNTTSPSQFYCAKETTVVPDSRFLWKTRNNSFIALVCFGVLTDILFFFFFFYIFRAPQTRQVPLVVWQKITELFVHMQNRASAKAKWRIPCLWKQRVLRV